MEDGIIIFAIIGFFVNLMIIQAIIRIAVKQALNTSYIHKGPTHMELQLKQTQLLGEIAEKLGVPEEKITEILNAK